MRKTLAELADDIWQWQCETFGDRMTVSGALNKLRDEVDEAAAAWRNLQEMHRLDWSLVAVPEAVHACSEPIHEELADCFFMLVQIGGLTTGDDEGCGLAFWAWQERPSDSFEVCIGRLKAHALWSDQWAGLLLAKAAWLDACASISALDSMPAAIAAKLAKNKARTWAEPAADGTISHVKGVG